MKTHFFRNALIAIALSFPLLITSSCKDDDYNDDTPGANEVYIDYDAYNPSTITVSAGTTITWENKDDGPHTVTSDTDLFDSDTIKVNNTYAHMFSTAGTFPYHCKIHNMHGTVVVQ